VSDRVHGRAVSAPDESGFVLGESPKPAPVAAKNARGRRTQGGGGEGPPPERPGALRLAWSMAKLLAGVLIVVAASGAVAWGAHRYAMQSPRFSVHEIRVSGAKRKSDEQIVALSGAKVGDNVFAVDTNAVEQKLLTDPWIKQVKVTRALPNTLSIELEERDSAALASIGDKLYLVTRDGEPFKELQEGDPYDLPVVTGVSDDDFVRDRERSIERVALGLEILRHWDRIGISKTYPAEEVHLAPGGEAVLTVGKSGITIQLGQGPWRKKMLMAERVITRVEKKGRVPGIVFADNLAHPERVVVRMR
jgi:cell division protein FtsQ